MIVSFCFTFLKLYFQILHIELFWFFFAEEEEEEMDTTEAYEDVSAEISSTVASIKKEIANESMKVAEKFAKETGMPTWVVVSIFIGKFQEYHEPN